MDYRILDLDETDSLWELPRHPFPKVQVGRWAKLSFAAVPEQDPGLESMWVEVLEDRGGKLTGRLDNEPEVLGDRLQLGASIEFSADQVSAVSWQMPVPDRKPDHVCDVCEPGLRRATEDLDEGDEVVVGNVHRYGYHVHRIHADEEGPGFDYTTGLFHLYEHPDLVIFGPVLSDLDNVLTEVGIRITAGERFDDDRVHEGLFEHARLRFKQVAAVESYYREHFGYNAWFYRNWSFPVLQMQWSDREGRFPGEPGFDPRFDGWQPRLDQA